MIPHHAQGLAEHDVSWLAIRQPAVLRLLERELGPTEPTEPTEPMAGFADTRLADHDAFGVALELACRVVGGRPALGDLRLDHRARARGLAAVRAGRCDRAMVRSLRDQVEELPVALTGGEQDRVATVIAAVIWSVLDHRIVELADTLVA